MTTDYTPNVNLYKWKTTDTKQTTITETASNADKIDAKLNDHTAQLASTMIELEDLTVNVRRFKTDSNTWNNALQLAINFAQTLFTSQPEAGGLYMPSNALVKMPRGRYLITTELIGASGVDFDFTECKFIAEPANKTINFINLMNNSFRNHYIKGAFAGFNTVYKISNNNTDTSHLLFDNPTFQKCGVGIDTVSTVSSRSTYLEINNLYSLETDCPLKVHTDMATVNGGWVTHSGYNGAAFINYANLKLNDVIFVPQPPLLVEYETRWIDNYTEADHAGDRALTLKHCRFGGETGAMPIVYNYANNYYYDKWQTKIIVDDCSIASSRGCFVFHQLPNYVKVSNCTGFIDSPVFKAVDETIINNASIDLVTFEIDKSVRNVIGSVYKLFNYDSMYKFLNAPVMDLKRYASTYYKSKLHLPKKIINVNNFTIPITLPVPYGNAKFTELFNISFLVSVSGSLSDSSDLYRSNSLYYVSVTAGAGAGYPSAAYKVNYTQLGSHKGGLGDQDEFILSSLTFNSSGSNILTDLSTTDLELKFTFSKTIFKGQVDVIPLSGNGQISYE